MPPKLKTIISVSRRSVNAKRRSAAVVLKDVAERVFRCFITGFFSDKSLLCCGESAEVRRGRRKLKLLKTGRSVLTRQVKMGKLQQKQ